MTTVHRHSLESSYKVAAIIRVVMRSDDAWSELISPMWLYYSLCSCGVALELSVDIVDSNIR